MRRLRVLMSREEIVEERLPNSAVVVIDVFMATTTLLTILENGASGVFPVASLEEGEAVSRRLDASRLLKGGEQDALMIEGYDCGPFPEEYPPEVVSGKEVVFLTTNGTRAIGKAASAKGLLIGSLRNAPAVARHLQETDPGSIYIICAGSGGRFTLEDFLGAVTILSYMDTSGWRKNDGAWLALDFADRYREKTMEVLKQSRAGRWFFKHDRIDTFEFVGDVGASELLAEVKEGRMWRMESKDHPPYGALGAR